MKKFILVPLCAAILFACGGHTPTKTVSMTRLKNGEMLIKFEKGPADGTFTARLDSLSDQKTFIVDAKIGQTLTATVTPSDTTQPANVRFNQIISPSGNADGPFGPDLSYELKEAGQWKFIVGESLMLGEPYTGEFTLTVEVK